MKKDNGSGLVVGLVVLAVIAVAVLYFWSDPFQARVDNAARQASQWTPENIQKDPVGYLSWALKETENTGNKLSASSLGLRTQLNQLNRELTANQADRENYSKLLDDAKALYRTSLEKNTWPADLRGSALTEEQLKAAIVEANDKVVLIDELITTYSKARSVVERKQVQLEQKSHEVTKLTNKLKTDLEVAKVNKSVEGIGAINDQVAAIMDTANALVEQQAAGVSLEDLVTPTGKQRVDAEFEKIMGGVKP